MYMAKLKSLLCLVILFGALIANSSYADSLATQLSRNKIESGDTFTISYILKSNASRTTPDFSPLEKDFQILSNNYGNSISIVNGSMTTQSYWQLILLPKRTGELIIPEISFGNIKSEARKLLVSDVNNDVANDTQASPVFVEADVNNASPYTQSQVVYTFKLFYQSQLENPVIEIPQTKEATFIQLGDGSQYETTIKGKPYMVIEKKFAIFPHNPGKLIIPPAKFSALSYNINANISYGQPFSINAPKRLLLSTKAFKLNVKNIPAQYHGATWLPASNISLTERWSDNSLTWDAGNPVTRTIIVQATGLRADQIPDLIIDKIDGINVYVDPPKRSNHIQDNTVIGTLEQQITYIPNTPAALTIPSLKLAWWNTKTNSAASTQLNDIAIQVKGSNVNQNVATPPNSANQTPIIQSSNLHTPAIPPAQPTGKPASPPFYSSIWFWLSMVSFFIWFITLILFSLKKKIKVNQLQSAAIDSVKQIKSQPDFSDASFKHACETGDAASANQLLLSWAKKIWKDELLNLEELCDMINDQAFTILVKDLEHAVYANHIEKWNGRDLLLSYEHLKKHHRRKTSSVEKNKKANLNQKEPLPPLNP